MSLADITNKHIFSHKDIHIIFFHIHGAIAIVKFLPSIGNVLQEGKTKHLQTWMTSLHVFEVHCNGSLKAGL